MDVNQALQLQSLGGCPTSLRFCLLAVEESSDSLSTWSIPDESLSDRHNLKLKDGRMVRISLRRMRKGFNSSEVGSIVDGLHSFRTQPENARRYCIRFERHDGTYQQD